mmetsp:Transcript_4283/g.7112  ORF Transcript_4283/g.7112 Transcript_4283/m.7112 type:complete len:256 (-) Transcript_4283:118-885(-)
MYGATPSPFAAGPIGDRDDKPLVALSDVAVRHGFIQKVYGLVGVQLTLTTLIASAIVRYGETYFKAHPEVTVNLMFLAFAGSMSMMCVFACCPQTLRQSPQNYLIMFAFTFFKSILIGFICINYTLDSVLLAVGVTAFVVLSLTIFACQTTYDFTGMGPYLFAATLVVFSFGFFFMLASWMGLAGTETFKTMHLAYCAMGTLLFSCYIVYHTQLIVGGKHQRQFTVDDYAPAAINLYIDIVQLFLFILRMLGKRR